MNEGITYTVDIICAWCDLKIGEKAGFTSPDATHGMCIDCYDTLVASLEVDNQS